MQFYVFRANIYKYFIQLYRAYPRSFFVGRLLSIFSSLLFSWMLYEVIFKKEIDSSFIGFTGTSDYLTYVVIGILLFGFVEQTMLNVSRSLITEKRMGTLESVFLSPYNRGMYFLAYMVAQTLHTGWELLVAAPMLLLFGIRFPNFSIGPFSVVLLVSLIAFLGLSMLLANVMLYTRDTYISQNTLFAVMFLICGITFPRAYLPLWVQYIGRLFPVSYSVDLFRQVILHGSPLMTQINDLLALLGLGLLYCLIGFALLPRVERIAIEQIHG